MKDVWRFRLARDTLRQQQWLAVPEEFEDPADALGDFENEGEFASIAVPGTTGGVPAGRVRSHASLTARRRR